MLHYVLSLDFPVCSRHPLWAVVAKKNSRSISMRYGILRRMKKKAVADVSDIENLCLSHRCLCTTRRLDASVQVHRVYTRTCSAEAGKLYIVCSTPGEQA